MNHDIDNTIDNINTPYDESLDNDFMMLLQSIGLGDMETAREFAKSFIESNKEALPSGFSEWIEDRLTEPVILPVPPEISHMVICEDVSQTFNPNRYWVSEREEELLNEIISIRNVAPLIENADMPFANSIMLHGKPGVGKTEFARCLAYNLNLPLVYINLCQVRGSLVGSTARNLEQIFSFAAKTPCIFLLDELDAIAGNRRQIETGESGDEVSSTTLGLMQCIDRLPENVILIATTNRIDRIDKGVLRRFTIIHELQYFSPDELVAMIVAYLQDINSVGNLDLKWDEKDIRAGCGLVTAQSDLINLCNRAIIKALKSDNVVRIQNENSKQNNQRTKIQIR